MWDFLRGPVTPVGPASWGARPGEENLIVLEITADGFLYNMVRCIVGTLVNVGREKWRIDDVARILKTQDRSIAGCTAPACGLYLVRVWYD
jgi:tRNA pseudouridine38-40 synthase